MERRMQRRQLKTMIDTGHYKFDPALVAEAMLRRPAVRLLLSPETAQAGQGALRPADRTQPAQPARRQAA
jgi:hypothetical protein